MKRILVATDFSHHGNQALKRALQLAAQHHAVLDVLHIITSASVEAVCELLPDSRPEVVNNLTNSMMVQLYQLIDSMNPVKSLSIKAHVRIAPIENGIIETADSVNADVLMLGSHGEHFAHEIYLGTTAENILARSQQPVLIVKAEPKVAYEKVGVLVDFSTISIESINKACELAPAARIVLLHAFQIPNHDRLRELGVSEAKIKSIRAEFYDHATEQTQNLIASMGGDQISSVLDMGYPPAMIKRWMETMEFDLIVMGRHGNRLSSVIRHAMHDSTSDVMIYC